MAVQLTEAMLPKIKYKLKTSKICKKYNKNISKILTCLKIN